MRKSILRIKFNYKACVIFFILKKNKMKKGRKCCKRIFFFALAFLLLLLLSWFELFIEYFFITMFSLQFIFGAKFNIGQK